MSVSEHSLFGRKDVKLCLPSDVCEVEKMLIFDSDVSGGK